MMDLNQARAIVRKLADGIDPSTGKSLPEDCPCQTPIVVRAFDAVLEHAEKPVFRLTRPTSTRRNAGLPWSKVEDQQLLDECADGLSVGQMAKSHGRSWVAIQARLEKYGESPFRQHQKPSMPSPTRFLDIDDALEGTDFRPEPDVDVERSPASRGTVPSEGGTGTTKPTSGRKRSAAIPPFSHANRAPRGGADPIASGSSLKPSKPDRPTRSIALRDE